MSLALVAAGLLAAAEPAGAAVDLGWMAGHWRAERGGRVTEEIWTCPVGGTLVGVSRVAEDGRTVGYEHMRIAEGPDGRPAFHAAPSGQAPSSFPMAEAGAQRVRFAEPAHDFPKSVQYARDSEALTAAISAEADGEPTAATWRFEKVGEIGCP